MFVPTHQVKADGKDTARFRNYMVFLPPSWVYFLAFPGAQWVLKVFISSYITLLLYRED